MSALTRDVFLWGPMGAGKSSAAVRLAALSNAEVVDVDLLIEQRAGKSVAGVFAERGESGFRALERQVLGELLGDARGVGVDCTTRGGRVIALGGGALLDRERRLDVLGRGTLVVLMATAEACLRRIYVSRETRPLLAGQTPSEAGESVRRLLADRAEAYAECHLTIDTSDRSVDEVAAELLPLLARPHVVVAAGRKTYPITLRSSTAELRDVLSIADATSLHVVTDQNVAALEAFTALQNGAPLAPVVLPAGERHKTVAGIGPIWDTLLARVADRRAVLIGIGGGVVTDMTGYAASAWHRGIRWVATPTTLLGMVDASVGGKTGVDFGPAKNAIGAFHPPLAVHAATGWLQTEPERSYRSGLVELLKTALIACPTLFAEMLADPAVFARRDEARLPPAVAAAASAKAAIVSRDPEERGERAVLNLGHTLGHALESAGAFERYTHGEAVGLGLLAAIRVGTALGITESGSELGEAVASLLATLGLPTRIGSDELAAALPLLGLDKKKAGRKMRFVALVRPGRPQLVDLPLDELVGLLRTTEIEQHPLRTPRCVGGAEKTKLPSQLVWPSVDPRDNLGVAVCPHAFTSNGRRKPWFVSQTAWSCSVGSSSRLVSRSPRVPKTCSR